MKNSSKKNFSKKVRRLFNENKRLILIAGPIVLLCLALAIVLLVRRNRDDGPPPDPVTLIYSNWNLGTNFNDPLELRMLQSFMDEYQHITVEIDTSITLPWMPSIFAAAQENRLPDVFIIDDLGAMVANGWLLDINLMARTDIDFLGLPPLIQGATMINDRVYALPFAQDIQGYFVNRDLFASLGLTPPTFGISAADFLDAVRNATDLSRHSIGLNHSFSFVDWYPGAVNEQMGFFGSDGLGFALNSPEMLEAVRIAAEIHREGYTFYSIPEERVEEYFPIGYVLGAFRYGQMAMFYGGTSWLMDIMVNQVPFDWDFIGVPGGRSIMSLEIVGVSANTNHPEEAYLLAKWMGHGTEGNLRRLQYAQEMGITISYLPVNTNMQVLNALWEIFPAPGFPEVYASMPRALVDGRRVIPGYMQARFSAPTGVSIAGTHHTDAGVDPLIYHSIRGDIYFPNHSATAQEVARRQLEIAREALR